MTKDLDFKSYHHKNYSRIRQAKLSLEIKTDTYSEGRNYHRPPCVPKSKHTTPANAGTKKWTMSNTAFSLSSAGDAPTGST